MKIEGMDGKHYNVSSQGQGGTALGLGIAGTALGLMNNNGCGGGLFGNILGGNRGGDCYVNYKELALSQDLATCRAERYADNIAREEANLIFAESRRQDEKTATVIKDTTGALIEIGNAVSGQAKEIACLQVEVARNREEAKTYTDTKVEMEAELRKAADQNVLAYTNAELAKKIDGTLVIKGDDICYNRCRPVLEACPCGSEQNPYNVQLIVTQAVQSALAAMGK